MTTKPEDPHANRASPRTSQDRATRSNAEESLANAEGFPCNAARRVLARLEG
jgi:hypothetical protein